MRELSKEEKEDIDILMYELHRFFSGEISYKTALYNTFKKWGRLDELHLFPDDKEKDVE